MSVLDELVDDLGIGRAEARRALRCLDLDELAVIDAELITISTLIDSVICELDARMASQLDEILHAPGFQALEAAWRELAYVVEHIDYKRNIRTELLSCSKEELFIDLAESPEVTSSGLYQVIYNGGLGQWGANPFGLLCTTFSFGPNHEDLTLLELCGMVAAMSHAPFIANASPAFLELDSFSSLPHLGELEGIIDGPRFIAWRSLRALADARYIGLCLPRFLLRAPYDVAEDPTMRVRYRESIPRGQADLVWGQASIAFAVIAAGSFARHGWCVFLTGADAGTAAPMLRWDHASLPGISTRLPLECLITSRTEQALAEIGFIGLVYERTRGHVSLLSAPSIKSAATPGTPSSADLGALLPYMFLVCRLAHYLKCVQHEHVGTDASRGALESALTLWIQRYVSDMDRPSPQILAERPLRSATIKVDELPDQPGWYRCHLVIQPHIRHNSASFTLSLVGKLDRRVASTPDRSSA